MAKQTKKKASSTKKKSSQPQEPKCPTPGCMNTVCCYKESCVNKQDLQQQGKDVENRNAKQSAIEDEMPKGRKPRPPIAEHYICTHNAKMNEDKEKKKNEAPLANCRTDLLSKTDKSQLKKKPEKQEAKGAAKKPKKSKTDKSCDCSKQERRKNEEKQERKPAKQEAKSKQQKPQPEKPKAKPPPPQKELQKTAAVCTSNKSTCITASFGEDDDEDNTALLCGSAPSKARRRVMCGKNF